MPPATQKIQIIISIFQRENAFLGKITKFWIIPFWEVRSKIQKCHVHPITYIYPSHKYEIDTSNSLGGDAVSYARTNGRTDERTDARAG